MKSRKPWADMYDVFGQMEEEYFSDRFLAFLRKEGIKREFSCRHTPQQNGVAKQKNRHILEVVWAMLNKKHMPKSYWAKAANTTVYPMNQCTTWDVHEFTPHKKFFGKKPDLSHVRIFSSIAYVHIPVEKRQKLHPKSEKCILEGYSLEQEGYKCYNPSTQKHRVSRDVVFDKSASWYAPETTSSLILHDPESAEIEIEAKDWCTRMFEESLITT